MAEENKSYGLAWFLAGLGVGALVGILYAPKSGKETREDIASGCARKRRVSSCAYARSSGKCERDGRSR
ncbi:MAG: YtxH domain-containing protein [Terracidiphilus sp.]